MWSSQLTQDTLTRTASSKSVHVLRRIKSLAAVELILGTLCAPMKAGEGQITQTRGNRVHSWDARVSVLHTHTHMHRQGFRTQREPSEATAKILGEFWSRV